MGNNNNKRENGSPVHSWLVGHLVPEGTTTTLHLPPRVETRVKTLTTSKIVSVPCFPHPAKSSSQSARSNAGLALKARSS